MPIVNRWARVGDFNPASPKQVQDYLRFKGYGVPTNRKAKEKNKPTTNADAIEQLLLKYPNDEILPKILDIRAYDKGISYLTDTFLGRDGKLHPFFNFQPKTGRLSSKAPNLMNLPQGREGAIMKEAADAIRGSIIPDPGCVLVELDWKAIEAVLVGFFAEDPDYIHAAKLGVHDILGSHILRKRGVWAEAIDLGWPEEKIKAKIKEFKRDYGDSIRPKAKKTVHAYSYGEGAKAVARDLGCPVSEALEYIEAYEALAPRVKQWKADTRLRAHYEGRLTNPFGYTLPFFEVFRFVNGEPKLGRESNECLAFGPQSTGAGMLRQTLLDLGARDGKDYDLLVPTHDSISLQVPEGNLLSIASYVKDLMEKPWPELAGLTIDVEIKTGETLADMRELKL